MKRKIRKMWVIYLTAAVVGSLLFAGCGGNGEYGEDVISSSAEAAADVWDDTEGKERTLENEDFSGQEETDFEKELTESKLETDFTDREKDGSWDEKNAVRIELDGGSAAASGNGVQIDPGTVTITDEGTYVVTGTLQEGQIIVDAADTDKIQLVLSGASIHCSDSAAIWIRQADKVFITLDADTENELGGGEAVDENDEEAGKVDGVIFSKEDLVLNGSGALRVQGSYKHGIVSKDDLVITGGSYAIYAEEQCMTGKDQLKILDGDFTLEAGESGVKAKNEDDTALGNIYIAGGNYRIEAGQDGLNATGSIVVEGGALNLNVQDDGLHADLDTVVRGGEITVENCYEGLEGLRVVIEGGKISVRSSDDGINAAAAKDTSEENDKPGGGFEDVFVNNSDAYVKVTGGELTVSAGGDGIDSNGSIRVTGGMTLVSGPEGSGDGALDYDGSAVITGGTVAAAGASGMAMGFGGNSGQCSVLYYLTEMQEGGSTVAVFDEDGEELFSFIPENSYSSVVLSFPGLKEGNTYTLKAGAKSGSFTLDSVSSIVGAAGAGNFGGKRGMGGDFAEGGRRGNQGEGYRRDGNGAEPREGLPDGGMLEPREGLPDGEMLEPREGLPDGELLEPPEGISDGELPGGSPDGELPELPEKNGL